MLAAFTWVLVACSALLAIAYFLAINFGRRRRPGEPPIVAGSLLWGSAAEFSAHAVNFLHRATKRYGDVFTIRLVNQHLTIIMDPHSYDVVSKERTFDFDPIQKQVNRNVFDYALVDAKKMLRETSKTVRGNYLIEGITKYIDQLNMSCDRVERQGANGQPLLADEITGERPWASEGLRQFSARTSFDAIFSTVFGRNDDHVFNSQLAFTNFEIFHKYFNYLWLGFPIKLFPKALAALGELVQCPDAGELLARPDISRYLRRAIEFMQQHDQTETDIKCHNLVYLHVNYNTFRLAFWVLNNLLEDSEALKALMNEIDAMLVDRYDPQTNTAHFDMKEVENMKVLDSIVQETTRLSSGVFMVRYVTADTRFTTGSGQEYLIREGDRVAMYPPALHKDPEIFEDPLTFKYDRFIDAKFYKEGREVKYPVMGFGTLCPGKRYALIELKWYIMTIVTRFDLRLHPGQHAQYDTQYHGHEVLPPVADITIDYRAKGTFPILKLRSDLQNRFESASEEELDETVSMAA